MVIIAAGLSRRFGQPKVLVPVGPRGQLLIDYSIHDAARAGIRRVVVVTRPELHAPLAEQLQKTWSPHISFTYVLQDIHDVPDGMAVGAERDKPWGTGHAVLAARNAVTGPFIVINCDDYYGDEAYRLAATHLSTNSRNHGLIGYRLDETLSPSGGVSRAECRVSDNGILQGLTEMVRIERDAERIVGYTIRGELHEFSGRELISMNFWAFQPSIFAVLAELFSDFLRRYGQDPQAEFLLSNTVNSAIDSNRAEVTVLESPDRWFGMTYESDLPFVRTSLAALTQSGTYPSDIASVVATRKIAAPHDPKIVCN